MGFATTDDVRSYARRSIQQYRIPRKVDGKAVLGTKGKPVLDTIVSKKPPKSGQPRTVALTQEALKVLHADRLTVAGMQVPSAGA